MHSNYLGIYSIYGLITNGFQLTRAVSVSVDFLVFEILTT